MLKLALIQTLVATSYANDLDAFVPEVWAQESLMILENAMVLGSLVHRDFENEIAQFGDVVNTRKPAKFTAQRKTDSDSVTIQDANAVNVPVKLDQHWHTSFMIKDGEQSRSFKDLANEYLAPAVLSLAEQIDAALSVQVYQFIGNSVGKLGTDPDYKTVVDAKERLSQMLAPTTQRFMVIPPLMEGALLKDANFINADKIGDAGSALREGSLGRKYGFDIYMAQQMPSVGAGSTTVAGTANGAQAAGGATLTVTGFGAAITNGAWCTVAGVPYRITATVGGGTPTGLTFEGGIREAVAAGAAVVVYTPALINNGAGYALAYQKNLTIDSTAVAPRTEQLVSFGANKYGILGIPSTTNIPYVDRPLEAALADNDVMGIGPAGAYGVAMHRNALALVTRPLATPRQGTGALSYVASYKNLSIRVTMTYNGEKQGTLVTVDILGGVKVLDQALAVPVLG